MDKAVKVVVSELEKQTVKVGDKVEQIATISANGQMRILVNLLLMHLRKLVKMV